MKMIRSSLYFFCLVVCLSTYGETAHAETTPAVRVPAPLSTEAQQLYASAQNDLLQLRVLLKSGHSQSSLGSGFLIGDSQWVVTNYHVVSQIALDPDIYIGEYKDTKGNSGAFQLFAVDAQHDLAIVKIDRKGSGFFHFNELPTLTQGEHLYSMGNPLDLGFTISEGTYNGITQRGFSDQIMFTGPVNPGMSGGPNVNARGQVVGINVAHRRDGELVSFLVPARFAKTLLEQVANQTSPPKDFKPVIGKQLLEHQDQMMTTLLSSPLSVKTLGAYQVPVRESEQVRCWGSSDEKKENTYQTSSIRCSIESSVYVSHKLNTGYILISHQFIRSDKLDALRFAVLRKKLFFGGGVYRNLKNSNLTTPTCTESFVALKNYRGRIVVCVESYKEFDDLFDFTLFSNSTDEPLMGIHSQLNLNGFSYANGQKFIKLFLENYDKASEKQNAVIEKQKNYSEKRDAITEKHDKVLGNESKESRNE